MERKSSKMKDSSSHESTEKHRDISRRYSSKPDSRHGRKSSEPVRKYVNYRPQPYVNVKTSENRRSHSRAHSKVSSSRNDHIKISQKGIPVKPSISKKESSTLNSCKITFSRSSELSTKKCTIPKSCEDPKIIKIDPTHRVYDIPLPSISGSTNCQKSPNKELRPREENINSQSGIPVVPSIFKNDLFTLDSCLKMFSRPSVTSTKESTIPKSCEDPKIIENELTLPIVEISDIPLPDNCTSISVSTNCQKSPDKEHLEENTNSQNGIPFVSSVFENDSLNLDSFQKMFSMADSSTTESTIPKNCQESKIIEIDLTDPTVEISGISLLDNGQSISGFTNFYKSSDKYVRLHEENTISHNGIPVKSSVFQNDSSTLDSCQKMFSRSSDSSTNECTIIKSCKGPKIIEIDLTDSIVEICGVSLPDNGNISGSANSKKSPDKEPSIISATPKKKKKKSRRSKSKPNPQLNREDANLLNDLRKVHPLYSKRSAKTMKCEEVFPGYAQDKQVCFPEKTINNKNELNVSDKPAAKNTNDDFVEENDDIYNAAWNEYRFLNTDFERYETVRAKWGSIEAPNPNRNLTVQNYGRLDNTEDLEGRSRKRRLEDDVSSIHQQPEKRSRIVPSTFLQEMDLVENLQTYDKEFKDLTGNTHRLLIHLKDVYEQRIFTINKNIEYCINTGYYEFQEFLNFKKDFLDRKLEADVAVIVEQFNVSYKKMYEFYLNKHRRISKCLDEVRSVSNFYVGLQRDGNDPTILTEEEVEIFSTVNDIMIKIQRGQAS